MFCPNCGNKLNKDDQFCSSCGTNLTVFITNQNASYNIVKEDVSNTINDKQDHPIATDNSIKDIIKKYKKIFLIVPSCLIVAIIGIVLFNYFFNSEKLSWNENYPDIKLTYVSPTNLKLGISFSNEEELDKIKYTATCGEVTNNGLAINWDLTQATGKCKITVSYKLKSINKEFIIINFNTSEEELVLDYDIDLDSEEDLDLDGLTNKQEKEYKTNPVLSDSDMDGLDDNYEIFTSKTDPNNVDSDNDGLSDYDEIELGLDPLKTDSKDDGIKDGDRTLTYNYDENDLKLSITGQGNIASTIAEIKENTKISSKTGLIDKLYTLYTDGNITEAIVTIPYTDDELISFGLSEDNLSIYYYNEKESRYEKIETKIDKENNILTATLDHFSNYVVGDESLMKESSINQVLFIIDNSSRIKVKSTQKQNI